jgi:diguanylate cyclase (GGDEF)-like protein/PAS domain S-box-containing protein
VDSLDTPEMGTWQWEIDADRVVWSEGVFQLHGRRPEDFEGTVESALADAHPDDRDGLALAIQTTLEDGAPFHAEYRCVRPDGRVVWLESKARCVRDADGKPNRLVGVCMDVTRRKQREQDHARIASIVASSTDAIIGKTVAGIVTSWNVGAERLFGYSAGEMIGQSIEVIVPPERRYEVRQILDTVARGECVRNLETVRLCKDGRRVDISVSASPVRNAHGRVVEAVTIMREHSAEAVTHTRLAGDERFNDIADCAPDLIFTADLDGDLIYVNPSFEYLLGYRVDALAGNCLFALVHADDRQALSGWPDLEQAEVRVCQADGEWRWLDISSYPVRSGDERHVVGMARDATERKEVEHELTRRALHDSLTDLPARELFSERLARAIERSRGSRAGWAVLVFDVDDFKAINDTYGHPAGDASLVAVTRRVRGCLRPADTLARLGGDEFGVLLEDADDRGEVINVCVRIMATLDSPVEIDQQCIRVSISIGAALGPAGFHEPAEAVAAADIALYRAKAAGKGRFELLAKKAGSE